MQNGVRVEQYMCDRCNVVTEFPRYNDIEKLLVTRKGRCGEFANMFTFLCRCFKYDARYIFCTSDHVWTEVYYHSKKRFVHIDPSENVFDSPYMYEKGWKRNLEYVIGE
jgi:peptide-N4-(N-acetyl-beta-glucosaminyl)asparagine amidase